MNSDSKVNVLRKATELFGNKPAVRFLCFLVNGNDELTNKLRKKLSARNDERTVRKAFKQYQARTSK